MRYQIISAMVRDFPNQVGIAYTPDDFRRLHGEGKFAVFISMLNAYPLGSFRFINRAASNKYSH